MLLVAEALYLPTRFFDENLNLFMGNVFEWY